MQLEINEAIDVKTPHGPAKARFMINNDDGEVFWICFHDDENIAMWKTENLKWVRKKTNKEKEFNYESSIKKINLAERAKVLYTNIEFLLEEAKTKQIREFTYQRTLDRAHDLLFEIEGVLLE